MSSPALTAIDAAVGTIIGTGAALLLGRSPRVAWLGLATAVLWLVGTLAGATETALRVVGTFFVLAHRGPLLHLLFTVPDGRLGHGRNKIIVGGAWAGAFLPVAVAGPLTAFMAALVATIATIRERHLGAGRSGILTTVAVAAGALAALWALAALHALSATALLLIDDALILVAGAGALSAATGFWRRNIETTMVVELGLARGFGSPITTLLARSLTDPALEVRYEVPALGWMDERGAPTDPPEHTGRIVTRANIPGGGTAALVHGKDSLRNPRLDSAAAAAAALALDAARLEAEVRARAQEVRLSRLRLLTVENAERRSLEKRLHEEVVTRITAVDELLVPGDSDTADVRRELHLAVAELTALGQGLYPPAISRSDLVGSLHSLTQYSPCPVTIEVRSDVARLPERQLAAAWFICSEAIANITRHSKATQAFLTLVTDSAAIRVQISDDGRGGATLTRGLRGLSDRAQALGGTLTISSPIGGPTVISALLPLPEPHPDHDHAD